MQFNVQASHTKRKNQTTAKLINSFSDTDGAELTLPPVSAAPRDPTTPTQELTTVRTRFNLVRTTLLQRKECDNYKNNYQDSSLAGSHWTTKRTFHPSQELTSTVRTRTNLVRPISQNPVRAMIINKTHYQGSPQLEATLRLRQPQVSPSADTSVIARGNFVRIRSNEYKWLWLLI